MQRTVIVDLCDQAAARSLSTLHPVEQILREDARRIDVEDGLSVDELLQLALVQQLEALRLAILALVAPEGS